MIKDRWRFAGSLLYLCAGIGLLLGTAKITGGWDRVFYLSPFTEIISVGDRSESFKNWPRYTWCLSFAMFGMSAIAFDQSKIEPIERKLNSSKSLLGASVLYSYFTRYFLGLALTSSLVFTAFNVYNGTRGYLFYFATAPTSFALGYLVDFFVQQPFALVRRWVNSISSR